MKKAIILIIIGTLVIPGCKFFNEKIRKNKGEDPELLVEKLKTELQQKQTDHQNELRQIRQISQAKIDSIISYYENELTGKGPRFATAGAGNYYLIVGSFKTPEYARDYSEKVSAMGYETEILAMGHWNFVSAESYNSWKDAVEGLEIVRNGVSVDSWILVSK